MLEYPVPEPSTRRRPVVEVTVEPCLHEGRRIIGMDETADYYCCDRCHQTLADMGGILWYVRPCLTSR